MPATDQTVFPHPDLTSLGSRSERDFDLVRLVVGQDVVGDIVLASGADLVAKVA